MSQYTIKEADERMMEILGFPNPDIPNRHQRLAYLTTVIDLYSKLAQQSPWGHLIDSFTLTLSANQTEYVVPVSNFEGLYHASVPDTGNDLEVINAVNADILGVAGPAASLPQVPSEFIAVRGIGEDRRLIVYPPRAGDRVKVWYHRGVNFKPGLESYVELHEGFHMTLVPVAAALMGKDDWYWPGMPLELQNAKKEGFLNRDNPMSLASLLEKQEALYKERIFNPSNAQPIVGHFGFAANRRRRRRRGY